MINLPKAPNVYSAPVWNQLNNSDVNGSLYASFNLDLTENDGKVRLGKRLLINTNNTDISELTSYPCGFKVYGRSKWAIAGLGGTGYVFQKLGSAGVYPSSATFSKVTGANTPTTVDSTVSDIEVSNGALYVTTISNSVYTTTDEVNGGSWATFTAGGADSGNPHMLASFQARTYMTRGNSQVISWDASNSVATSGTYTVDLGNTNSNIISFIRASSNRIWIGVVNTNGGKGYVYEWDGTATQVQKSYRLESPGAVSCVIKDDIPHIMDVYGTLLVWNGGTFKPLISLNRLRNKLLYNPLVSGSSINNKFIHPNGMSLIKGRINMLIDGRNTDNSTVLNDTIEETIPSGVWEYDENKGLYHKHSFGLTKLAGTIIDYGQTKVFGVGALAEINLPSTDSGRNGTFLAGASYYTNTTATASAIFYDDSNDTLQKGGSLITVKLPAVDDRGMPSVQNMYQNIYTLYRKLLNANDKITIKYRKEEIDAVIATATWVTSTTFTTTTDVSLLTGYEVEPILGLGSGKTSHIVSVVNNAGTYTVTVDEIYTSATSTSQIRIQNWKKISTITSNSNTNDQGGIGGELTGWIQFKLGMIFTGKDEIERLIIINQDYNPPT